MKKKAIISFKVQYGRSCQHKAWDGCFLTRIWPSRSQPREAKPRDMLRCPRRPYREAQLLPWWEEVANCLILPCDASLRMGKEDLGMGWWSSSMANIDKHATNQARQLLLPVWWPVCTQIDKSTKYDTSRSWEYFIFRSFECRCSSWVGKLSPFSVKQERVQAHYKNVQVKGYHSS